VTTQALLSASARSFAQRARAYYALTKPRVVSLIVFTAVIGMFLATPGMVPVQILLPARSASRSLPAPPRR
jgi:protoheme IX farnesyltransferase